MSYIEYFYIGLSVNEDSVQFLINMIKFHYADYHQKIHEYFLDYNHS